MPPTSTMVLRPKLARLALLLALSACAADPPAPTSTAEPALSDPSVASDPGGGRERAGLPRGAQIELGAAPELDEIARLEYRRSTGNGRLLGLLDNRDDRVRLRAVQACGRLPFPAYGSEITNALSRRMEDPVAAVRHATAFALGLRGDPNAGGTLASYRNDPDPVLRARVIEAVSRLEDPQLHSELLVALRDTDPRVRIEAATGTARWDPDASDADEVDRALLDALRPYRLRPSANENNGPRIEPEFVWRVLYALSRRSAELGRGAFLEYAAAPGTLECLFAVRGLARIEVDAESGAALARALADPDSDWRTAYEAAIGLGQWPEPAAIRALSEAVEHENAHVRAAAMASLGGFTDQREEVLPVLRRGQLDLSTEVRVEALRSLARLLEPADALRLLDEESRGEDTVLLAGVAAAGAELANPGVTTLLERLARNSAPRVATQAVLSLGSHPSEATRAFLHEMLGAPDNGLRLAAVLALREMPDASDREPLERAFRTAQGDIATEIGFNVLENLSAIGTDEARLFLENALEDPRPHIRRVARRLLIESFGGAEETALATTNLGVDGPVPIAGEDYPRYRFNPLIEIVTSRGTLVFELFPAEAPVHVYNFIQLARNGAYEGLSFHRVVPDFVVQGGDYRGDGNGARPWNDAFLPQEFTPRKYTRGSLGMPRNEDPESGGSQFFVTQRPTPHLDGNYTLFGELRQGGDVLDRIEVGDRILTVRPLR